MKAAMIAGILLVAVGIGILVMGQFSYKTEEKVLEVGPLKATAEHEKSVPLPPMLGWGLIVGGVIVLVVGAGRK